MPPVRYKASELALICTADGNAWWQPRTQARTHTTALFSSPEPRRGDLVIEVDDGEIYGRRVFAADTQVMCGSRRILTHSTGKKAFRLIRSKEDDDTWKK